MFTPFNHNFSNTEYLNLLDVFAKLSGLFSENTKPFINYRIAENIFCKAYNAVNLSRSDAAFDAKLDINGIPYGIGLKTFTVNKNKSLEKVAEFNSMSAELMKLKSYSLTTKLAELRNARIDFAKRLYGVDKFIYHIVARKEKELVLFDTNYDYVDLQSLNIIKDSNSSIIFKDKLNDYNFNYSKSTLFKQFEIPKDAFRYPIEILEDPYALLVEIFSNLALTKIQDTLIKGIDYVVLPLYGRDKIVFSKSGINQWNAGGRKRVYGEVYIPVPMSIHNKYPDFFPNRDEVFKLETPDNQIFDAKLCQDNSKALMTNPNKALSDWLLRQTLQLNEGEIATNYHLDKLGVDSVIIYKDKENKYKIDIMKTNSYEEFINE